MPPLFFFLYRISHAVVFCPRVHHYNGEFRKTIGKILIITFLVLYLKECWVFRIYHQYFLFCILHEIYFQNHFLDSEQGVKSPSRHFIEDILGETLSQPLDLSCRNVKKKLRTSFTGWQIYQLEKIFEERKYINCEERKQLSRWNKFR